MAKVGIGCGVLIILGVIAAIVAAVMGVSFFRKQVDHYVENRSVIDARWDGAAVGDELDEIKSWFDLPVGLTGLRSVRHTEEEGRISGMMAAETAMPPIILAENFSSQLENAGFERVYRAATEDEVLYRFEQGGRKVEILITPGTGVAAVAIEYSSE